VATRYPLGSLLPQIYAACESAFRLKLALRSVEAKLPFVDDVTRSCARDAGAQLSIDINQVLDRVLNQAHRIDLVQRVRDAFAAVRIRNDILPTAQMRGHDFVQILLFTIIKLAKSKMSTLTDAHTEAMLYAAQASIDLCATNLVRNVFARL
jgi:hypothetical protein